MNKIIVITLFIFQCLVSSSWANDNITPSQFVRAKVDEMIAVLEKQNFKDKEEKEVFNQKIRDYLNHNFDWLRISQKSLGSHWQSLNSDEKDFFTDIFHRLIENLAISLAPNYNGQNVSLISESVQNEWGKVTLQYHAVDGRNYDVIAHLIRYDNSWRVYDVSAEGVSLIDNYYAQFNSIVSTFSITKLFDILKLKSDK